LYQELKQANSKNKVYLEAINPKKAISAYHGCVIRASLADLACSGQSHALSKPQVEALQMIYVQTLAQVYKSTRSIYIKLLKQIKPSAYIEIQGMHSHFQERSVDLGKGSRGANQLPKEIELQDLYSLVLSH